MKRKKSMAVGTLGTVALVLVVVVVSVLIYNKSTKPSVNVINKEILRTKFEACNRLRIEAINTGKEIIDIDGDKFPDTCDVCIGGNDLVDHDQDFIPEKCDDNDGGPNICDKKDKDCIAWYPPQKACESTTTQKANGGHWIKETEQCCLLEAGNKGLIYSWSNDKCCNSETPPKCYPEQPEEEAAYPPQ